MSSPLAPDTILDGRYKILALLGSGGMGRVYLAEHLGLGGEVAVKVVESASLRPELATRFEREARAAGRLDHPGCVRVTDAGKTPTHYYYAMERLEGPTLGQELERRRRFSVREAVAIAIQMLDGLAHAHARGVLHRDIKPHNVMRRSRKGPAQWVLIDFGLARVRDEMPLTAAGVCPGSPSYIAPERLMGLEADARADLYATGVVLYEMLAGARPFVASKPMEIARRHLDQPVPRLRAVRPDVPVELDEIVARALAKDPDARWVDAAHMGAALARLTISSVAPPPVPGSDPPPAIERSETAIGLRVVEPKRSPLRVLGLWVRSIFGGARPITLDVELERSGLEIGATSSS